MKTFIFVYLLAACYHAFALKDLQQAVVQINAQGINGNITFTEIDDMTTRIVVNLQGLKGEQGWHVHKLPVDQTISRSSQCLSMWAGPHYDPTGARNNTNYSIDCTTSTPQNCEYGDLAGRLGPLPRSGKLDTTDSTGHLRLRGIYSIVGRSVVIHERGTDDNFECGTIRHQKELDGAEVTILQSIFVSPVAGRMYFKQVDGVKDVQMWGKLYYVDDRAATMDHNWHVHQTLPVENYRIGACAEAGPHYNPTGADVNSEDYQENCTPVTPTGCEVGDLTGKLGPVNVAATPGDYASDAFFFTDMYLNLTGTQPIIDRSIVVHVPDGGADRLGCAPLVEAENITLTAFRSKNGVPLAVISQYSRYQDTRISLGYLPSLGVPPALGTDNGDLTIVSAAFSPNGPCPLDGSSTPSSDSTYAPTTPVADVKTPDGYELGDITNAYNDNVTSCNNFSASDLPVFGARTTISGLTLRYSYGNRRECGALLPPTLGNNIVAARASFRGREITGNVYFFQERTSVVVTGSTFIVVDIYYTADRSRTSTHNWHIHQNPSVDGQVCVGIIGGHYNPFSVSLESPGNNSDYSADCNGNYQLRCESGDMSGKHGQLEIASGTAQDRPTYTYYDNNLELGGTYSILGRSVGLHLPGSGGALFDCATINTFSVYPTTIVSSVPMETMTNRVAFAQQVSMGVTDSNNVLILNQYVIGGCVKTTMEILGDDATAAEANGKGVAERVETNFNSCTPDEDATEGVCPLGAAHLTLSLPLLLLLLLPSLLTSLM